MAKEVKKAEVKAPKAKSARKLQKEAILDEKHKVEVKIDAKFAELKETKDKAKRKELKREINELRHIRSRIGKRDTFFSDVRAEMRLVRWPSRQEVVKYTIATLVCVGFFALFFYGIDALFALVKGMLNK